ncbi:MAG: Uncharacterized protein XE05_1971 [Thermotogales bacterium 46_20]|nr:MAG: Uncharacterized protein XE05_1971 [Thermotogales bacterium 46_20]
MFFLGKKELSIIELFKEHLFLVDHTMEALYKLLNAIREGDHDTFVAANDEVHENETRADDKRRELETEMYRGAFLPNFRGDLLGLVETFDKVADSAESVADQIILQKMTIPERLIEDIIALFRKTWDTFRAVRRAAEMMFEDLEQATEHVKETERLEHSADDDERALIRKVFDMELSLAEKQQLRELILTIGSLADISEDCSDRIEIVILKRRV